MYPDIQFNDRVQVVDKEYNSEIKNQHCGLSGRVISEWFELAKVDFGEGIALTFSKRDLRKVPR